MAKRYQLVIIGTRTTAMVAAMRVRAAGWSVDDLADTTAKGLKFAALAFDKDVAKLSCCAG